MAFELVSRVDLRSGKVSSVRRTPQGGLIARTTLTRTGVFPYKMPDGSVRREFRPADEVLSPRALASFKNAPVTIDHPGRVHPGNWREHVRGHVADAPTVDNEHAVGDIVLQDGKAINDVEDDKLSEVSCGYDCAIDPTPGTWNGQPYDVVQRNHTINHVAIGPKGWGRMGPTVKMHLDSGAAVCEIDADDDDDDVTEDRLGDWVTSHTSPKMPVAERKALGREAKKEQKEQFKQVSRAAHAASAKIAEPWLKQSPGQSNSAAHIAASEAHAAAAKVGHALYSDFPHGNMTAERIHDDVQQHERLSRQHAATAAELQAKARGIASPLPVTHAHDPAAAFRAQAREAGEHALRNAAASSEHAASARESGSEDVAKLHDQASRMHKEAAAEYAKSAGGDWDEGKHPRDMFGKFDYADGLTALFARGGGFTAEGGGHKQGTVPTPSNNEGKGYSAGALSNVAKDASRAAKESPTPEANGRAAYAHVAAMKAHGAAGNDEHHDFHLGKAKAHVAKMKELAPPASDPAHAGVSLASAGLDAELRDKETRMPTDRSDFGAERTEIEMPVKNDETHAHYAGEFANRVGDDLTKGGTGNTPEGREHPKFAGGDDAENTHFAAVDKESGRARGAGRTPEEAVKNAAEHGHTGASKIYRTTPEHAWSLKDPKAYNEWAKMQPENGYDSAIARRAPSNFDSRDSTLQWCMTDEEKRALEGAQAKASEAAAAAKTAEAALTQARSDSAAARGSAEKAIADQKVLEADNAKLRADAANLQTQNDLLKLQIRRETEDAADARTRIQSAKELEATVETTIKVRDSGHRVLGKSWKHDGKSLDTIRLEVVKQIHPDFSAIPSIEAGLTSSDETQRRTAILQLDSTYTLCFEEFERNDSARADIRRISASPIRDRRDEGGDEGGGGGDDEGGEDAAVGKARKAMEDRKKDGWKKIPKRIDRLHAKTGTDRRSA